MYSTSRHYMLASFAPLLVFIRFHFPFFYFFTYIFFSFSFSFFFFLFEILYLGTFDLHASGCCSLLVLFDVFIMLSQKALPSTLRSSLLYTQWLPGWGVILFCSLRLPFCPPVEDAAFGTNLRLGLFADQACSFQLWGIPSYEPFWSMLRYVSFLLRNKKTLFLWNNNLL